MFVECLVHSHSDVAGVPDPGGHREGGLECGCHPPLELEGVARARVSVKGAGLGRREVKECRDLIGTRQPPTIDTLRVVKQPQFPGVLHPSWDLAGEDLVKPLVHCCHGEAGKYRAEVITFGTKGRAKPR